MTIYIYIYYYSSGLWYICFCCKYSNEIGFFSGDFQALILVSLVNCMLLIILWWFSCYSYFVKSVPLHMDWENPPELWVSQIPHVISIAHFQKLLDSWNHQWAISGREGGGDGESLPSISQDMKFHWDWHRCNCKDYPVLLSTFPIIHHAISKGRPGISVSPCLESQGCQFDPAFLHLICSSA